MKKKLVIQSANRPDSDPPIYAPIGWPLGFNPSMDQHAHFHGATHWSCVGSANDIWIRRDGEVCRATFKDRDGYLGDLRRFDRLIPMRPPLPMFAGKRKLAK